MFRPKRNIVRTVMSPDTVEPLVRVMRIRNARSSLPSSLLKTPEPDGEVKAIHPVQVPKAGTLIEPPKELLPFSTRVPVPTPPSQNSQSKPFRIDTALESPLLSVTVMTVT